MAAGYLLRAAQSPGVFDATLGGRLMSAELGIANQLPMLFDSRATPSAGAEWTVSDGYQGKCAP